MFAPVCFIRVVVSVPASKQGRRGWRMEDVPAGDQRGEKRVYREITHNKHYETVQLSWRKVTGDIRGDVGL